MAFDEKRDTADLVAEDRELLEHYLTRRDQEAFEALLQRHGAMVLGVCRRILGNEADAHDAFQATFLIFVRKAGSIRPPARVGNWLHGVAHKTALKARAMNRLYRAKLRQAATRPREVDLDREELLALDDKGFQLGQVGALGLRLGVLVALHHFDGPGVRIGAPFLHERRDQTLHRFDDDP